MGKSSNFDRVEKNMEKEVEYLQKQISDLQRQLKLNIKAHGITLRDIQKRLDEHDHIDMIKREVREFKKRVWKAEEREENIYVAINNMQKRLTELEKGK